MYKNSLKANQKFNFTPPTPQMPKYISVRSGDVFPVSGIWEAANTDSRKYFEKGTKAPFLGNKNTVWRTTKY